MTRRQAGRRAGGRAGGRGSRGRMHGLTRVQSGGDCVAGLQSEAQGANLDQLTAPANNERPDFFDVNECRVAIMVSTSLAR